MRILLSSDLYFPAVNGISQFTRTIAQSLAARGHTVGIIAPSPTGKNFIEHEGDVTIYRVRSVVFPFYQNIRISMTPYAEIRHIVKAFNPDVMHTQLLLGIGQAVMRVSENYNIPMVSTSHAMPENLMDNLKSLSAFSRPINYMISDYGRRFHNRSDIMTSPTQSALDGFGKHIAKMTKPILVISNGINLSVFKPIKPSKEIYKKYHLPTNKPIVTYIGRLDVEKHVDVVIRAFSRVLRTHDAHLLIVGYGVAEQTLRDIVSDLGINEHVTFAGFVPEDDKIELERVGYMYCIASPAELQCIAALEAMASGQPLVAVNAGALPELCHDGENGFLFERDNVRDAAEKIALLLDNPKLRDQFSQKSIAIAKHHDIAHTTDEFEKVYKQAIAEKQARKHKKRTSSLSHSVKKITKAAKRSLR